MYQFPACIALHKAGPGSLSIIDLSAALGSKLRAWHHQKRACAKSKSSGPTGASSTESVSGRAAASLQKVQTNQYPGYQTHKLVVAYQWPGTKFVARSSDRSSSRLQGGTVQLDCPTWAVGLASGV